MKIDDLDDLLSLRDSDAPSELELDRLHLEELDSDEAAELQARVASSETGADRMTLRASPPDGYDPERLRGLIQRAATDAGVLDDAPAPQWREAPKEGAFTRMFRWLWSPPGVGALGVALGVVALFVLQAPPATDITEDPRPRNGIRSKGSVRFTVYRQRGGTSEEHMAGAILRPGDSLQFGVGLAEAAHVMIVGLEERGEMYAAWPIEGSSQPLPAAHNTELSGAVELDGSTGKETLHAIACDKPFTFAQLQLGVGGRLKLPEGCGKSSFPILKRTKP